MRYETEEGGYETIPDNSDIRQFIWEHLCDVHHVLHCLRCAGATVSAKKLFIAVPEVIILGHKCNYEGRVPDDLKIMKIRDWPPCKNLSDVWAFLGITGYMRIWIKNYSTIARPLVNLTRKGTPFVWEKEHENAMQTLKDAIVHSPALISIDYTSDHTTYLSIDSSYCGVGWILSQDCADGRCHPAHFGSISWNERKACYSQAKLELYGLFQALRALHLHLIGICQLMVEMNAQFIRGMLNNPDMQPNTMINRWIATILLFNFKLTHMPADKHKGPDDLSRQEPAEGEDDDNDHNNLKDWINKALALGIWVVSWVGHQPANSASTPVWTLGIPSGDEATTFPPSDSANKADDEMAAIHQYLTTRQHPPTLEGDALARFLNKTKRFLAFNGRLWRQQMDSRHQLYAAPHQQLDLVHDAHDKLGHKGFYSTRRTLLD
jgi:hypothetical protein